MVNCLNGLESRAWEQLHLNTESSPQLLQIASMIFKERSYFRRLITWYLLKSIISTLKLTTG